MNKLAIAITAVASTALAHAARAGNPEADATYQDIKQTLGLVPSFFHAFPDEGIAAAWDELKSVQLNPATALPGSLARATLASTAASYWIGPSTGRSVRLRTSSVASRTRSTSSPFPDSPVEYDSIATRGSMPNVAAVSAELMAMSASCAVSGFGLTAQSP